MRTAVAIVGAGPAGLMLSHLLSFSDIDSVIVETRSREAIEGTIRAGVLEQGTVDLLTHTGVGERLQREGARHTGFELRFGGAGHRIDLEGLTGRAITVYAQHEVLKDLIEARVEAGTEIHFEAADVQVHDVDTPAPRVTFTSSDGRAEQLRADVIAGCDGSQGTSRQAIPGFARTGHFRAYPFGWFGILAEAPPSSAELIYAHSDRGFALVSTRSPKVQRMYFQCHPDEDAGAWSDEQIWAELQARTAMPGFVLQEGRIFSRGVIPMRSFVCEPMQHGRLFLAGDAAHTVPPTGAKGLNLAIADVRVLARALEAYYGSGRTDLLEAYSVTVLRRVWRAQHFSWWMTSMLHLAPDASGFDVRRQRGELDLLTSSRAGSTYLAESYVGWPFEED